MTLPLQPTHSGRPTGGWFPWDRRLTAAEVRVILADEDHPRRPGLVALILREARHDEAWNRLTPLEVDSTLPHIPQRLGRARPFWTWLFREWRRLGFLD